MDKHTYNNGFALLEVVLSMSFISIMLLIFVPSFKVPVFDHYLFIYDYIELQSSCILSKRTEEYLVKENIMTMYPIVFNERGNVQIAQTIEINKSNQKVIKIVCNLGGGRIVVKQ